MGVTLNKDGTPRKVGSGKTKGAGCYENISLRDLRKLVNENAEVSVSRVWLRNAQAEKKARSVQFDLQPPKVKPEYIEPISVPAPLKKVQNPIEKEVSNEVNKEILSDDNLLAMFKVQALERAKEFDLKNILPIYENLYNRSLLK